MKTKKQMNATPTEGTENQEPKKKGSVLNTVVNVILVIALIVAAVCTYISFVSASGNGVPSILGLEFFSIQTDSMSPTLEPGDLAICKVVKDVTELRVKDVITYWTVINGERVLNTHRIEAIYDGGSYLIFGTKGDNNTSADPLTVHQSEIVGIWTENRIHGAGKVLDYLQTSTGFLIVIVIPVFLFFLFHLVQFFRVLFEYQNVKNRIKYEQERGRTEDLIAAQRKQQAQAKELERAAIEAELREKLKAELMASMGQSAQAAVEEPAPKAPVKKAAPKKAAAPKPVPKPVPVVEEAEEEEAVVEAPAPKKAVKKAEPVVEEPEAEDAEVQETEVEETEVSEEKVIEEETAEEVAVAEETSDVEEESVAEDLDEEFDDEDLDDEDLDDEELYAGGSLDDLLFGGDEEEVPEE